MSRPPMTSTGAEVLRAELKELKTVVRPRIVEAIATAREHGDLKENAEYHAAREQQSFAEGRIKEIDAALSNAEIIDVIEIGQRVGNKIVFGATVELFDIGEDKDVTYKIVGELEADIKQNLISVTSPIARALIGKSVDDEVVVNAPGGEYLINKDQKISTMPERAEQVRVILTKRGSDSLSAKAQRTQRTPSYL